MDQKNITLVTSLLVLVLGFGAGYFYRGDYTNSSRVHMMSDGSMMGQGIDQHFIAEMIPHHEGAISMAKIALERSQRAEILSLARGIIEAQEKEIADMRSWHQVWFGSMPTQGGMGMAHMDSMSGDVDALWEVSPSEFDREFIEQMIPHHEMAVMMARMLQVSTDRSEMKELADQIITSQSREITMMRSWKESWY